MWWNFVARDHQEIDAAYVDWQSGNDRFGAVTSTLATVPALRRRGAVLRCRSIGAERRTTRPSAMSTTRCADRGSSLNSATPGS
jgi:hypothetical protein